MKKIFFFAIAIATLGCSHENGNTVVENEMLFKSLTTQIIDPLDSPDLNDLRLDGFFGITDVVLDNGRDVILDETNSVLHVPIKSSQISTSLRIKWPKIKIKIKIAKLNVRPGSGCTSCVDCIGFRCRTQVQVIPTLATTDDEYEEDMAARPGKPLTKIREQLFWVDINKSTMTIDYYPINNIEWKGL